MIESRPSTPSASRLLMAIAALGLLVFLVLLPAVDALHHEQELAAQSLSDLTQLPGLVVDYRKVAAGASTVLATGATVTPLLEKAAQESGIPQDRIAFIRSVGADTSAELKFENIPGDYLVRFFHAVQRRGLKVQSFQMTDFRQDGFWTIKAVVSST